MRLVAKRNAACEATVRAMRPSPMVRNTRAWRPSCSHHRPLRWTAMESLLHQAHRQAMRLQETPSVDEQGWCTTNAMETLWLDSADVVLSWTSIALPADPRPTYAPPHSEAMTVHGRQHVSGTSQTIHYARTVSTVGWSHQQTMCTIYALSKKHHT